MQISNLRRFFHPDYTVGSGIARIAASQVADSWLNAHHRRWGVTPRPETDFIFRWYHTRNLGVCQSLHKKMGKWQAKSPPNRFFPQVRRILPLYRACIQKKTIRWAKDLFENSPSCPGDLAFPRKSPEKSASTTPDNEPWFKAARTSPSSKSGSSQRTASICMDCPMQNRPDRLPGFPFRLCQTPRIPLERGCLLFGTVLKPSPVPAPVSSPASLFPSFPIRALAAVYRRPQR